MRSRIIYCLAIFLVFYSCNKKADLVPTGPDKQVRLQAIADSMRQVMETQIGHPIPSMSFYIQTSGNSYFVSTSSGQPATSDMWLRMASVTKIFTASAIMNMWEDGWIGLDDTITQSMPGFGDTYVPDNPDWDIPYKNQITIRQLLSHTAGVYDSDNDPVPFLGGVSYSTYMLQQDPDHAFTASQWTASLIPDALSYFPPGTNYHYSNVGYSILGEIVARVYSTRTGLTKTFGDYVREALLAGIPAAATGISFPESATDNTLPLPAMNGHEYDGVSDVSVTSYNSSLLVAQGNGMGTYRSIHDWLRYTFKGEGPLDFATVESMNTPWNPDYSGIYYGLGTMDLGILGRGHDGLRAGNITAFSYDISTDISIFCHLPFWDLRNPPATVFDNGYIPLLQTASLLKQELQP